jgi:hypothetical protein
MGGYKPIGERPLGKMLKVAFKKGALKQLPNPVLKPR